MKKFTSDTSYLVYYLPRPPIPTGQIRVRMVDPGTIAAVVEAGMSYLKGKEKTDWQNSVSNKLNIIILKLDEIINELRSLRAWFEESQLNEARRFLNEEVEARRKTVEDIVQGLNYKNSQPNDETRVRLLQQLDHIRVAVDQLCNWPVYGFVQFPGVVSGTLTILLVMDLLGLPEGEMTSFIRRIVDSYFALAINGSNEKSIEYARNQLALTAGNQRNEILSRLNKWWLINLSEHVYPGRPRGSDGPEKIGYGWSRIMITGTPETGLNFDRVESHGGRGFPDVPFYPGLGEYRDNQVAEAKAALVANLNAMVEQYLATFQFEASAREYVAEIAEVITKLNTLETPTKLPARLRPKL